MTNKTVFSLVIEAAAAKVRKRRAPAAKAFANKKRYTRKQKHAEGAPHFTSIPWILSW